MLTTPGALPPADLSTCEPGWHGDLASGAPGIALLHTVYAAQGLGSWDTANSWLAVMGRRAPLDTTGASLYRGVPTVAYVLRVSLAAGNPAGMLGVWMREADAAVAAIARLRLRDATARRDHGASPPPPSDWNLSHGLTGFASALLARDAPDDQLLRDILTYLVDLTHLAPDARLGVDGPGEQGGWGLWSGLAGVLALLALAADESITVPGHYKAIDHLSSLCETSWGIFSDTPHPLPHDTSTGTGHHGARWPGGADHPPRPSWCDGTAGIARALQLAAIVLDDPRRQLRAETVLADCLRDIRQARQLTDFTVGTGWSGLFHTLRAAATDARPASPLADTTPHFDQPTLLRICDTLPADLGDGLLTGKAGMKLAALTPLPVPGPPAGTTQRPGTENVLRAGGARARWDDCLLVRRRTTPGRETR
jgi:class I lanthipeptide synthase